MGGGDSAPKAYTPANQAGADSAYYGTLSGLTQQDQATQATAAQGYNAGYQGVANNPWTGSAMSGAVNAANTANAIGNSDIAQGQLLTAQGMQGYGYANNVAGYVPTMMGDASAIRAQADPMNADAAAINGYAGQIGNAAQTVGSYADTFNNYAKNVLGYVPTLSANAETLRDYAPALIQAGFDPNMANYNFGMQGAKDAQNVANAQNGVGGSPLAAGLTGDAMQSFDRSYQADRTSRATAALAALGLLFNNASGLDQAGMNAYTTAGGLNAQGVAALGQMAQMQQGAAGLRGQAAGISKDVASLYPMASSVDQNALGLYNEAMGLTGQAGNLAAGGSSLMHQGNATQEMAALLPYETQNQIYQDRMTALDQMVNGMSAAGGNVRGDVQGYGNYLNIGQNATALDQNAAKINNSNSFLGGLGQLFGTLGSAAIGKWG